MKPFQTLILGIGIGIGVAAGLTLPNAGAMPSDSKLDKRVAKLLKRAVKKGTVEGGIVLGVVTDNKDPERLGRVLVRFPWLGREDPGTWTRVVAPEGEAGLVFRPEIEDEVLVAFLHGDIRAPVVIGSLWSGQDPPGER